MRTSRPLDEFRVSPGEPCRLDKRPTKVKPFYKSKNDYQQILDEFRQELSDLQDVLYAHAQYAVLLVFQGMDASGKDGAIKHVMSGVNPQGCQVVSFKQPSSEELRHDFLWRVHLRLPQRGRIGIFNRSHYEEVLVARVYPEILEKQNIPPEFVKPKKIWHQRFEDIVNWENYLHRNGTRIVKFYLHLSKEEQRKRFLDRIDEPSKNWKLSPADIVVRQKWDAFQAASEECLSNTSTEEAPWYTVPADDKRNARLIISYAIIETMKSLNMSYPEPTEAHRQELQQVRKLLEEG